MLSQLISQHLTKNSHFIVFYLNSTEMQNVLKVLHL